MKDKSGVAIMLGVGKKPRSEEPPPLKGDYGASETGSEPASGPELPGMCSVMCPKCGEAIPLEVKAGASEPVEATPPEDLGGEAA